MNNEQLIHGMTTEEWESLPQKAKDSILDSERKAAEAKEAAEQAKAESDKLKAEKEAAEAKEAPRESQITLANKELDAAVKGGFVNEDEKKAFEERLAKAPSKAEASRIINDIQKKLPMTEKQEKMVDMYVKRYNPPAANIALAKSSKFAAHDFITWGESKDLSRPVADYQKRFLERVKDEKFAENPNITYSEAKDIINTYKPSKEMAELCRENGIELVDKNGRERNALELAMALDNRPPTPGMEKLYSSLRTKIVGANLTDECPIPKDKDGKESHKFKAVSRFIDKANLTYEVAQAKKLGLDVPDTIDPKNYWDQSVKAEVKKLKAQNQATLNGMSREDARKARLYNSPKPSRKASMDYGIDR